MSLESTEDSGDSGEDSRDSTSHESHEGNRFLRKVSSGSMETHSEDRQWSTRDNDDDDGYFRLHRAMQRKWANDQDSHYHSHSNEIDGSDDQSANTGSLVSLPNMEREGGEVKVCVDQVLVRGVIQQCGSGGQH